MALELTKPPKPTSNLRIEEWPYPHLRDDGGCILASDYMDEAKLAFILEAVREKLARSHQ